MGADLGDSIGVREEQGSDQATPHDKFEGFARHKGTGLLQVSRIAVEDQIRTEDDPEADAQLVESVRQVGLLQPLRVRWREADGKWVVLIGHRRFRAAVAAGLETVPVICVDTDPTPADVVREQIFENKHRTSISPLDEARAYQKYMALTGCTGKDLAKQIHVSQPTVSRVLSLLDLPVEVQAAVEVGDISPTAASEIARVQNPEVAKQVAAKAVQTKAPVAEVARTVRSRQGVRVKATTAKPLSFKLGRGVKVVVYGRLSGEEVVAALVAATEQARQLLATDEVEHIRARTASTGSTGSTPGTSEPAVEAD
jgi:ParB family chromosome partitioning protein